MAAKRSRSQKLIDEITSAITKFPVLKSKAADDFITLIKKNAKAIDSYTSTAFKDMVRMRQAYKLRGLTADDIEKQVKAEYKKQIELLKIANSMTDEQVASIEAQNAKASASRASRHKVDIEL